MALFGLAAVHASGCVQPNASHCANLDGDATCAERGGTAAVCSKCTSVNDGCVGTVTAECAVGGGGTSEPDTTTSDATMSSTLTDGTFSSSQGMTSVLPETGDETTTEMRMDVGPVCGDGMVNVEGETCDGDDLDDATCQSFGYGMGTLACTEECSLNLSDCEGGQVPCGDGDIDEPEECDGTNFGDATCAGRLGESYGGGLYCEPGYCTIDDTTCCILENAPCDILNQDCCPGLECKLGILDPECQPP